MANATTSKQPRFQLMAFAILFCVWVGFLTYQVLTTANPAILSRPQILAASYIVEAEVISPKVLKVSKVWWGNADDLPREVKLQGAVEVSTGKMVLAPLEKSQGNLYEIARAENGFETSRKRKKHIYPATKQAQRQLESLLEFRREQRTP